MAQIPKHILEMVHRLADEKLPVERIAFMTRLSRETVERELGKRKSSRRRNTTRGGRTLARAKTKRRAE